MFGNIPGLVFPRLKSVNVWPRGSAASTSAGPRKPVPPRMRIFSFFGWAARAMRAPAASADAASEACRNDRRRIMTVLLGGR